MNSRCVVRVLTTTLLSSFTLNAERKPDDNKNRVILFQTYRFRLRNFRTGCCGNTNSMSKPQVRENATCGDRLTEGVASKLQFLTSKNYSRLFSELSEAAMAYEVAKDQDGAKVNQHRIVCEILLPLQPRRLTACKHTFRSRSRQASVENQYCPRFMQNSREPSLLHAAYTMRRWSA